MAALWQAIGAEDNGAATALAELWQALEANAPADVMVPAELVGNEHLRWGYPGGECTILVNDYFVTCHDNANRVPSWVTYHLTAVDMLGDAERADDFRADNELRAGERAELADYERSGYDRGHMAPAAAFKRSEEAMSQTFVLSNTAPQTPALNRQMWRMLEEDVREVASNCANVWVFTGSLFLDEDGGMIEPLTFIGENRVAVPTHFFKAIFASGEGSAVEVAEGAGDTEHAGDPGDAAPAAPAQPASRPMLAAFVMPNQPEHLAGEPKDYVISIDLLEALSGLDFFSALPDSVEDALERQTTSTWPTTNREEE